MSSESFPIDRSLRVRMRLAPSADGTDPRRLARVQASIDGVCAAMDDLERLLDGTLGARRGRPARADEAVAVLLLSEAGPLADRVDRLLDRLADVTAPLEPAESPAD